MIGTLVSQFLDPFVVQLGHHVGGVILSLYDTIEVI